MRYFLLALLFYAGFAVASPSDSIQSDKATDNPPLSVNDSDKNTDNPPDSANDGDKNTDNLTAAFEENKAAILLAAQIDIPSDFHAQIDHLRLFVHHHTAHGPEPSSFDTHDLPKLLAGLKETLYNNAEPINIKCGQRSKILEFLVRSLGYQTNWVNIITDTDPNNLLGHVFLEVMNPDSKAFEIVDSDMNVYYTDGKIRLGILQLLNRQYSDYIPCNEIRCGWDLNLAVSQVRSMDYMKAAVVFYGNFQKGILYIGPKFDPYHIFSSIEKTILELFSPDYFIIFL